GPRAAAHRSRAGAVRLASELRPADRPALRAAGAAAVRVVPGAVPLNHVAVLWNQRLAGVASLRRVAESRRSRAGACRGFAALLHDGSLWPAERHRAALLVGRLRGDASESAILCRPRPR